MLTAILISLLATAALAGLGRWIWIQGVAAGWEDAAETAQMAGMISSRTSWQRCGDMLADIGPTRLGMTEGRVAKAVRSIYQMVALAAISGLGLTRRKRLTD